MSNLLETTIRVPSDLRDQLRNSAKQRGLRQAEVIRLALAELEQADFLRAVAATPWEENLEARSWDEANLVSAMDPWEPEQ